MKTEKEILAELKSARKDFKKEFPNGNSDVETMEQEGHYDWMQRKVKILEWVLDIKSS